jgi:hypothetical protein
MSINEAKRCYASLSEEVFTSKNRVREGKFDAKVLERVIKRIVKEHTGKEDEPLVEDDLDTGRCKT